MKICFPVADFRGLESPVYGHFGSAPMFALVDTESMTVESVANRDRGHAHGRCSPMQALANTRPEAVVVGGIGRGALLGLRALGVKVYQYAGSIREALEQIRAGALREVVESDACGGQGHGAGCH